MSFTTPIMVFPSSTFILLPTGFSSPNAFMAASLRMTWISLSSFSSCVVWETRTAFCGALLWSQLLASWDASLGSATMIALFSTQPLIPFTSLWSGSAKAKTSVPGVLPRFPNLRSTHEIHVQGTRLLNPGLRSVEHPNPLIVLPVVLLFRHLIGDIKCSYLTWITLAWSHQQYRARGSVNNFVGSATDWPNT